MAALGRVVDVRLDRDADSDDDVEVTPLVRGGIELLGSSDSELLVRSLSATVAVVQPFDLGTLKGGIEEEAIQRKPPRGSNSVHFQKTRA